MYVYIYIYVSVFIEYGVRAPDFGGSKREKSSFRENLREACSGLAEVSEDLGKPRGIYGRMQSRNPVLQFPLRCIQD